MGKCPRCGSPQPHLHPAVQFEGEVQPCEHPYHKQKTPQNPPLTNENNKQLQEGE